MTLNPQQFGVGYEVMEPAQLIKWANPDIDTIPAHRDEVDRLADSFREHGYDMGREDHPIEVLRRGSESALLEGNHRAFGAYYAGLAGVPVKVHHR